MLPNTAPTDFDLHVSARTAGRHKHPILGHTVHIIALASKRWMAEAAPATARQHSAEARGPIRLPFSFASLSPSFFLFLSLVAPVQVLRVVTRFSRSRCRCGLLRPVRPLARLRAPPCSTVGCAHPAASLLQLLQLRGSLPAPPRSSFLSTQSDNLPMPAPPQPA